MHACMVAICIYLAVQLSAFLILVVTMQSVARRWTANSDKVQHWCNHANV